MPQGFLLFSLTAFAAWSLACAVPAAAQVVTVQDAQRRVAAIDEEVAGLDDVIRKIRGENHRVVIGGTVGDPQAILVSPEQVETLFVTALLNGSMRPNQAANYARAFGELTREFLASLEQERARLLESRARIAGQLGAAGRSSPPPTTTPVPTTVAGSASGRWSAGCSWNDAAAGTQPSTDGGTFSITFNGQGGVTGSYQGANGSFGVSGTVGLDGSANGSGTGDGWSVNWSGRFDQRAGAILGSGGLTVAISSFGGGSCTGTWAVP